MLKTTKLARPVIKFLRLLMCLCSLPGDLHFLLPLSPHLGGAGVERHGRAAPSVTTPAPQSSEWAARITI